jgi:putative ABC transport system permease protein
MNDLRFALRALLKCPSFTAVAVLTLALGIGANTAMFSVINSVLIRPLPFPDAGRLVSVWQEYPKRAWPRANFSLPNFLDLRSDTNLFSDAGAYALSSHTLTGSGEPRRLNSLRVSASLLPTLQVRPLLGRNFTEAEDHPDGERVVLLGERLWRGQFRANPSLIGSTIRLNDEWPVTVVGVLPAGFRIGEESPDLCLPLRLSPAEVGRGQRGLEVIARLNPAVGADRLKAGLAVIADHLRQADTWANADVRLNTAPLQAHVVGGVRKPLLLLGGAVACVLLIACANVANLSLARALARQPELTIRSAIGAGRGRIIRLLLTESLLIAALGGVAGLALGWTGIVLAEKTLASTLPQAADINLDPVVLVFTLVVSAGCGVLFGLMPALATSKVDLTASLKDDARNSTPGRARFRLRSALMIAEVSLAFVLLAGAGLLLRSLAKLNRFDPGFDASEMLVAHTVLSGSRYTDNNPTRVAAVRDMTARLAGLPGVRDVVFANSLPMTGDMDACGAAIDGRSFSAGEAPFVHIRGVGGRYFETLRVPLVAGRPLAESDNETATKVAVVNTTMARRFWPDGDALGKRIRLDAMTEGPWLTVIGVVSDIKNESLTQAPRPEVYFPYVQFPTRGVSLMLRTVVAPLTLAEPLKREVWKTDATLAITDVRTLEQSKAETFSATSFQSLLLGSFAALAAILAATGIYSVLSYSVNQRSREIGIRVALGARPSGIQALVMAGGMKVVTLGLLIGTAGTLLLTRFMKTLLFEVGVTDPVTLVTTAALLAGIASLACYLPSRRASRVDPMKALKSS